MRSNRELSVHTSKASRRRQRSGSVANRPRAALRALPAAAAPPPGRPAELRPGGAPGAGTHPGFHPQSPSELHAGKHAVGQQVCCLQRHGGQVNGVGQPLPETRLLPMGTPVKLGALNTTVRGLVEMWSSGAGESGRRNRARARLVGLMKSALHRAKEWGVRQAGRSPGRQPAARSWGC